jgi:hypothetical protein
VITKLLAELLLPPILASKAMTPEQWEFIGVFCVLMIIFVIVYNRIRGREYRKATDCLKRQAMDWGGVMGADGMSMTFDHKGVEIFVAWGASEKSDGYVYTSFQKDPAFGFSFRILNNKGRTIPEMVAGASNLGIETLEGFWIRSNYDPHMLLLLTPEVQQDLLSYSQHLEIVFGVTGIPPAYSHLGVASLDFKFETGRLWIFRFGLPQHDAHYDAVIRTTLMFYEELDRIAQLTPRPAENETVDSKS